MKKSILLLLVICLITSLLSGCIIRKAEITQPLSEEPKQTEQPAQMPIVTATNTPTPTVSQSPSPEPSPKEEALIVVESYISTNTEEKPLSVNQDEIIPYANYVRFHIKFNTEINYAIREYMELNGEKIDRSLIDIQDEILTVTLSSTLPEEIVISLNKGYEIFQYTLNNEYTYEFAHEPALIFDFAFYDTSNGTKLPVAKLFMKDSNEFLYTFNKPIDKESLEYSSNLSSDDIETVWVSDTELVMSIKNIADGYNWVSINNINGLDQIYGNKLRREGWLRGFEAGLFGYHRIPQQTIYTVVPETAEVETFYEPEYGLVYLSMSSDSRFIEFGIATEASEFGLRGYKAAILDTKNMKLAAIEDFGKGIIPDTILENMIIPSIRPYEMSRTYEVWDDKGNMHFEYGNHLYNYNIADETFALFYDNTNKDFLDFPIEHLSDGNLVYLRPDELVTHEGVPLSLVIVSPTGVLDKVYETPFKSKGIAYMTFYMADVDEIDEDRLLIYGYAQVDSSPSLQSAYILNLNDGSTEFITKSSSILGFFTNAGLIVVSDQVSETEIYNINFISLDGEMIYQIRGEEDKDILDVIFNSYEKNFYIKQYDRNKEIYSIMIFNIDDNELIESGITFENDFDMMGFDGDGRLLLTEHFDFTP